MEASEILERIKRAYHLKTDAEVADFLDMKPSTLSMQKNRESLDLQRIIKRCSDINKNWLLDGEGPVKKARLENGSRHIPVYSSLSLKNKSPDFHRSIRAGSLYADVTHELDEFASSKKVFGYVVTKETTELTLQRGDIAIIKLGSSVGENCIYLVSEDQQLDFQRFPAANYASRVGEPVQPNGGNIIGKLVWVIRRVE